MSSMASRSGDESTAGLYERWQHARHDHDLLLISLGYAPPLPVGSVLLSRTQMLRIEEAKEREHQAWLTYWAKIKSEMSE